MIRLDVAKPDLEVTREILAVHGQEPFVIQLVGGGKKVREGREGASGEGSGGIVQEGRPEGVGGTVCADEGPDGGIRDVFAPEGAEVVGGTTGGGRKAADARLAGEMGWIKRGVLEAVDPTSGVV